MKVRYMHIYHPDWKTAVSKVIYLYIFYIGKYLHTYFLSHYLVILR